jgi:hypothetical protein
MRSAASGWVTRAILLYAKLAASLPDRVDAQKSARGKTRATVLAAGVRKIGKLI